MTSEQPPSNKIFIKPSTSKLDSKSIIEKIASYSALMIPKSPWCSGHWKKCLEWVFFKSKKTEPWNQRQQRRCYWSGTVGRVDCITWSRHERFSWLFRWLLHRLNVRYLPTKCQSTVEYVPIRLPGQLTCWLWFQEELLKIHFRYIW